eukprot:2221150-Rhodomonas_salina.1
MGCLLIVCGNDGSVALYQVPEQSLDVALTPTLSLSPHLLALCEKEFFCASIHGCMASKYVSIAAMHGWCRSLWRTVLLMHAIIFGVFTPGYGRAACI